MADRGGRRRRNRSRTRGQTTALEAASAKTIATVIDSDQSGIVHARRETPSLSLKLLLVSISTNARNSGISASAAIQNWPKFPHSDFDLGHGVVYEDGRIEVQLVRGLPSTRVVAIPMGDGLEILEAALTPEEWQAMELVAPQIQESILAIYRDLSRSREHHPAAATTERLSDGDLAEELRGLEAVIDVLGNDASNAYAVELLRYAIARRGPSDFDTPDAFHDTTNREKLAAAHKIIKQFGR